MRYICVYCGSRPGRQADYIASAEYLARTLVARQIGVVYGGGSVGMMGALATAAMAAGGEVIGVIPEDLVAKEASSPPRLTELRVVASMHERKAQMAHLADGFVALPGGFGTLEELFEMLTWAQLGLHRKPCGLLNVAGYYDQLAAFIDYTITEGFVKQAHSGLLMMEQDANVLLDRFANYQPPC